MKKGLIVCCLSTVLLFSSCVNRNNANLEGPEPNTSTTQQKPENVLSPSAQVETSIPAQSPTHTLSPTPTPRPTPTPKPSPTPDMSTLFPGVFNDMAAGVGVYRYDECVKRINDTGFAYKTGGSISRRKIQFSEVDGYILCLWFVPDNDGQSILTSVHYYDVNINYELDVTDNDHSTNVTYSVYDEESDPTNTAVSGIEELYAFFYEEMPRRRELYREAVKDNEMIDVTLEASAAMINGEVFITVKTNLPNETKLAITVMKSSKRITTTEATVYDGKAVSEAITEDGKPLSGRYLIRVIMKWPSLQPNSVKLVIGKNGEFLTGPYVIPTLLTPEQQVQRDFDFGF